MTAWIDSRQQGKTAPGVLGLAVRVPVTQKLLRVLIMNNTPRVWIERGGRMIDPNGRIRIPTGIGYDHDYGIAFLVLCVQSVGVVESLTAPKV